MIPIPRLTVGYLAIPLSLWFMLVHLAAMHLISELTFNSSASIDWSWLILFNAILAVFLGSICSPVAFGCLRSKSLNSCWAILTGGSLCTATCHYMMLTKDPSGYFLGLGATVLLFHAICLALFSLLADVTKFHPWICRTCSYDLTGNVSGVCPECGTKIE